MANAQTASTDTFVTALVFNLIVFGAEIAAFTILRPRFPAIYQPRTFSLSVRSVFCQLLLALAHSSQPCLSCSHHAKPLAEKWYAWPVSLFRADYDTIKAANGLDAYFFVRFLRMAVVILLPIWIVSWIVIMPVDSVKTGTAGNTGLDIFTFGNVGNTQQGRYAAHLILAWLFTCGSRANMATVLTLINPVFLQSGFCGT